MGFVREVIEIVELLPNGGLVGLRPCSSAPSNDRIQPHRRGGQLMGKTQYILLLVRLHSSTVHSRSRASAATPGPPVSTLAAVFLLSGPHCHYDKVAIVARLALVFHFPPQSRRRAWRRSRCNRTGATPVESVGKAVVACSAFSSGLWLSKLLQNNPTPDLHFKPPVPHARMHTQLAAELNCLCRRRIRSARRR